MIKVPDLETLSKQYGIKVERPSATHIIGTKDNLKIEVKLVDDRVETTVAGLPKVPLPIKGVLTSTSDGHLKHTVFVGPMPVARVKYKIPADGFFGKIFCCIEKTFIILVVTILGWIAYALVTPFPDPVDVVVTIVALAIVILAPILAFEMCM